MHTLAPVLPSFLTWFTDHMSTLDALILDIDGLLICGGRATPGSGALLERLRQQQFPFCMLTNDGSHAPAERCGHLAQCGLNALPHEIISCSHGLATVVSNCGLAGTRTFAMGRLGNPCYAADAGLTVTRDPAELSGCRSVIVGEDGYDWEPAINAAINFLIANPEVPLIVPNPDEYYPSGASGIRVAAGGVARFMQRVLQEAGVRVDPTYLGKPYRPIFDFTHTALEARFERRLERRRMLMLGDSLGSDIKGARTSGYQAGLVLTGVTRPHLLAQSPLQPDVAFARL